MPQTNGHPQLPVGSNTETIRVLLVDDHPAFRFGVREIINLHPDIEVCGEASDGAAALQAFRSLRPDVVLLDISLPGTNGIEIIKMMKAEQGDVSILVLSMHDETIYGLRSLRAGAKGYLRKDHAVTHLVEALRTTAADDFYVSRRFLNQLIRRAIHAPEPTEGPAGLENLTDREMEVFQWLGRGLGTRQVAEVLRVSVKTVESHRAHMKTKLCLETGSDLVKLAKQWHSLEGKSQAKREAAMADGP